MALWLKIYLYGCLASLLVAVCTMREKDGTIEWTQFWISAALCIASWSAFLGLVVGHFIKRNQKNG